MIRFLLLVLIFVMGLAGGALWFGQMHHLRSAVPDQLPGWTQVLPDDAGLRQGEVLWPKSEFIPALRLSWRFAGVAADGLHWDLALQGQGVDVKADFALFFWPDRGNLTGTRGAVSDKFGALKLMVDGFQVEAEGLIRPETLQAEAKAEIASLAVQLEDLGRGEFVANLRSDGHWGGQLQLREGVAPIDANLTGQRPDLVAELDMVIAEIDQVQPELLSLIERLGQREGDQMRITARLPGDLAGF